MSERSKELVAQPSADGETIYVTREEANRLGNQGVRAKYASICVQRRQNEKTRC